MTPNEALGALNDHGGDAGSDFNDGDLNGWFGWEIDDDNATLTVNYEPADENGDPGPTQIFRWQLVAVPEV